MANCVISPSLLKSIKYPPSLATKKCIKENFSLGMEEWECSSDDDDFVLPPPTKRRGNCSNKGSSNRFAEPTSLAVLLT